MDERQVAGPAEARAGLDRVADSRRAAVRATRRPAWIDGCLALVVGAGMSLGLAGQTVAAVLVFALGCVGVVVALRRVVRRQGQVFDQRAVGARLWRFALLYGVLFLLTTAQPPASWQPWSAIGIGAAGAAGSFAWLRWEDRYQGRRLASGDYDRYDLL